MTVKRTSVSKENDSNKHQTSHSYDSKNKNVLEISPWYFASHVHQECIRLEQGKRAWKPTENTVWITQE